MIIQLKQGVKSDLLRADKQYVVLAVYIGEKNDFMVLGDDFSFPIAVPSEDVNIIDNRLSKHWILGNVESEKWMAILAIPEWANDKYFYQNLVEGNGKAGEIFRLYERRLKNEYADVGIQLSAKLLKDDWYQCPICEETWQSRDSGEVLVCHGCNARLLNPNSRIEWKEDKQ